MDGPPPVSEHTEASASLLEQRGAADAYRPRYEVVAGQILELIRELAMRPGDRLPTEKDLALRLGTSRTVVRDAVKILSASGRVSAQKGRGLYVANGEPAIGAGRWGPSFGPTNLDHIFMRVTPADGAVAERTSHTLLCDTGRWQGRGGRHGR